MPDGRYRPQEGRHLQKGSTARDHDDVADPARSAGLHKIKLIASGPKLRENAEVSPARRTLTASLGGLGVIGAVLGVMYLVVACESLPSFLGQVQGDTHPRTALGAVVLALALVLATIAAVAARGGRNAR